LGGTCSGRGTPKEDFVYENPGFLASLRRDKVATSSLDRGMKYGRDKPIPILPVVVVDVVLVGLVGVAKGR